MRRLFYLFTVVTLFLVSSCSKENEDLLPVSNNITVGKSSVASFTATLTGTFSGVDKINLALGVRGVLYCTSSEDAEQMFRAWLDGSDNPGCIVSDKATVNGESIQCLIDGLIPDTEYSYCLFLQKRDGTREISAVSTFKTKPFNPDIKEVVIKSVHCFAAVVESSTDIDEKDAGYCEIGFIVSEQENCNISNSIVFKCEGVVGHVFTVRLARLEDNKEYYCRSYLKYPVYSGGYDYLYSPEKSFKTEDYEDFEEVAVDLGLSSGLLWATRNVGAEKPEDYGDYYAWGETATKSTYTSATYKFISSAQWSKYVFNGWGTVDNKTILDAEDDVAHVKWGGDWRMPTRVEFDELITNCIWTWTMQDSVYGYKVSGKKQGYENCSIFLPAATYRVDASPTEVASSGNYWSSSLCTDNTSAGDGYPGYAWRLDFNSVGYEMKYDYRVTGRSVRPVCP